MGNIWAIFNRRTFPLRRHDMSSIAVLTDSASSSLGEIGFRWTVLVYFARYHLIFS